MRWLHLSVSYEVIITQLENYTEIMTIMLPLIGIASPGVSKATDIGQYFLFILSWPLIMSSYEPEYVAQPGRQVKKETVCACDMLLFQLLKNSCTTH
jgi:hypothetical protein